MTTKFWAIEPSILIKYREFKKNVVVSPVEIEKFMKRIAESRSDDMMIVDGVAVIEIRGILGEEPGFYGWLYGGGMTLYPDIIEKLNTAEANQQVEKVQLRVNSGGGRLDGLFKLLYRIRSLAKPVEAIVGPRADSAAYGIVSQADKIIAENEMSEVGSVGVGVSIFVDEEIVDITSSDAPNKWPDVTKAAGVDVVRAELDEIHEKFATIIAEGRAAATLRSISLETVNANFGQGGTMLAESGLAAGMIDEIIPAPARQSNADFFVSEAGKSIIPALDFQKPVVDPVKPKFVKNRKMDLKTLKNEHPETYAQVFKEVSAQERSRVLALLKLGKSSGKIDYAIEQVEKGTSIRDDMVMAEFMVAQKNKNDVESRADDDPPPVTPESDKTAKEEEEAEVAAYVKRAKAKFEGGK